MTLRRDTQAKYKTIMDEDFPANFTLYNGETAINPWLDFICTPAVNFALTLIAYHCLKFNRNSGLKAYQEDGLTEIALASNLLNDLNRLDLRLGVQFVDGCAKDLSGFTSLLPDWSDLRVVPKGIFFYIHCLIV